MVSYEKKMPELGGHEEEKNPRGDSVYSKGQEEDAQNRLDQVFPPKPKEEAEEEKMPHGNN